MALSKSKKMWISFLVPKTKNQKKNLSALFSDYTLKYIDTIPFDNCLIVIIVLTRSRNTFFTLYILPRDYIYLLYTEELMELYPRRICICKSQNEIQELQQLFDHTLGQLEIECDETKDCSYFTEALDKCTKLKSFSFYAGYNNTVDCPSSETILVPAMRNMIESLSLKKIEVLKLTNCNLNDILSLSLVPANDIGDEGSQALSLSMLHKCSEISSFPRLRRLNLSNCNIKDAGISFLANALK